MEWNPLKWKIFRKKETTKIVHRAYAGAGVNRLLEGWTAGSTSADSEIRSSLTLVRNRSRQLVRDNENAINIVRNAENNVVGLGIGMQSQVMGLRGGKLDQKVNDVIEYAWEKWKKSRNCHVEGSLSFQDIERLILSAIYQDGEIYIRKVYKAMGDSKVPFALEIIEGDYLDENYNAKLENGNIIKMGVERNQWGRPVAYHMFNGHPGDDGYLFSSQGNRNQRRRIPAEEIIALFPRNRASQVRGMPLFAAAIVNMHHLSGMVESEVVAARASAALMGFIESDGDMPNVDEVSNGEQLTNFEPGVFKKLSPGEKMNVPNISRPNSQFDPFVRIILRGMGAGVGQSYESVSNDYSQGSYSSARQALLADRANYRVIQEWLIRNFHDVIYEEWLYLAVLSGEISLKGFEINPEFYTKPKWLRPGFAWIDPLKEAEAFKVAVRGGFKTLTDVIAEQGGDIEEVFKQRAREIELAKQYGLTLETDPASDPKQMQQAASADSTIQN